MADETLTPQAGDVWVDRHNHVFFVYIVGDQVDGKIWLCQVDTLAPVTVALDRWNKFIEGGELRFRDGKPYQPPTPSQVGDVITVECVVVRHPQIVTDQIEVHGYQGQSASQTMLDVQDENNDYVLQISMIKVDVPKSLLHPVSLPPVTAAQA